MIPQLSILVQNKPGELRKVTGIITENNVNCLGLSTYDATDFGVFHLIVNQPEKLKDALTRQGYSVLERHTIAVGMEDEPGYINQVLDDLSRANINVDCLYTFVSKKYMKPVLIFRTEDAEETEIFLKGKGYHVFATLDELTE